jgi:hypothetical protein
MKKTTIICFLILISTAAFSQLGEKVYYNSPIYIEAGASYQSYESDDNTISVIYFPISVMIPLTNEISLTINNNPYIVKNEMQLSDVKVNHFSDTKLNFRYIFLDKRALLNVFMNLPSGKTKLELEEFDTFTELSMGILRYKINTFGEGFNIGMGFNYAYPIDKRSTVGAGISYNVRTEYQPINLDRIQKGLEYKYNPSDELGLNLSYFNSLSESFKLSLDAYYIIYSYAQLNSNDLFKPGSSLSMVAGLSLNTGTLNHNLILNLRTYGNNKQKQSETWIDFKNSYQLDADYKITQKLSGDIDLFGLLQMRSYGEHQDNWDGMIFTVSSSTLFSLGAGTKIPVFSSLGLTGILKYNIARVKISEDEKLNGFDLSVKFNYAF